MNAPKRFADWLTQHEHRDPRFGWVYRYLSRSDAHSIALCQFILDDLLACCPLLRARAMAGKIVYGINARHTFPNGKRKSLDLAIGTLCEAPRESPVQAVQKGRIDRLIMACEAKTVMTEHAKSQPRVFDELASSHEIVHQGDRQSIAAGVTVVNIARTFVSPLRQKDDVLFVTRHKQPEAAERMVRHLRGLPIRSTVAGVGFDAYSTIVVDCDNQGPASVWENPPAPRIGEPDHYSSFIASLADAFTARLSAFTKPET